MSQPEIRIVNDYQTLQLIQDGAMVFSQTEDLSMEPTYRAILIDDQIAHFASIKTGQIFLDNPGLMTIFNAFLDLLGI
jgi:hypothetical protein